MSRTTFFEVRVLDAKTKEQLCFLDKVEPHSTIADIKSLFHKSHPHWYPARQALMLDPKDKSLRDEEILQNLPVGTTANMYFRDLGPQLGWTMPPDHGRREQEDTGTRSETITFLAAEPRHFTRHRKPLWLQCTVIDITFVILFFTNVFLAECIGPLLTYLLFYFRVPYIYSHKYAFTSSPHPVVRLACACHTFHYVKKLIETIFVHRFSHGTMPLRTIVRNCAYYWSFSAWLAYYINHPLYTPPSYGELQVNYALVIFAMCELGNFSIHLTLNNLKGEGSRIRRFPAPTKNPFTWLFFFVSCPNYTYEVGAWVSFSIMTQCLPVALYALLGFIQMTIWAKGKHRAYSREFKDYPSLRMAIIPLIL